MSGESMTTVVGSGVYIEGSLTVLSSIDIEGTLKGNLTVVGDLIVGTKGTIEGDIIAKNADIRGKIYGTLTATENVTLETGAVLIGDLLAAKVNFMDNSTFNGKCTMIRHKELSVNPKTKKVELINLSPEDILTGS
jgi:cytoskeletal protein CcmA (bactofilin family)